MNEAAKSLSLFSFKSEEKPCKARQIATRCVGMRVVCVRVCLVVSMVMA